MENENKTKEISSEMSNSQKKRLERKKKNAKIKTEALVGRIVGIVVAVLIIAGIGYLIGSAAVKEANKITPSSNYSEGIDANGYVKGTTASSIVTLPEDYAAISVPKSEVDYTDAMFEEEIEKQLNNHKVLNNESTSEIIDGDKVNIDYVGSIDGVEFEGGSTDGAGSDLTIGSGMFIPGFEEQLIGHKVGENFDIDVTFPEEYSSADLAGKDAVFNITVNGIYEKGTFDDAFVEENLKAYATTVDGYRQYLADKNHKEKLNEYVLNYLKDNTNIASYPKKYLKNLKCTKMYSDHESFTQMNQMYQQYYGYGYNTFEEYTGQTEEEYIASLDETCKEEEKVILAYQAIAEKEGISASEDDIRAYMTDTYGSDESYDDEVNTYGLNYLMQKALDEKVIKFVKDNAVIK